MKGIGLTIAFIAFKAFCQWGEYLDAPNEYAAFPRSIEKLGGYRCDGFDVEEYRQANGPGTSQRVLLAVPHQGEAPFPAIAAPFYFPEAMLGFDPKTGNNRASSIPTTTSLTNYEGIAYMAALARRGYITASAEAYHLTYSQEDAPKDIWKKWRYVGEKLCREWPQWTGIGKLTFDTRLLIDLLTADPRVDTNHIGIIGHSLGGKMAFYAGCLDPRIRIIVASDFGIGWDQTNWSAPWYWGDRLKTVRARGLDHTGLLSLAGGKPFCLIAGKYDDESSGEMMRRVSGYAEHPERLLLVNHATGHRPPPNTTEIGYRFLDRYLKERK